MVGNHSIVWPQTAALTRHAHGGAHSTRRRAKRILRPTFALASLFVLAGVILLSARLDPAGTQPPQHESVLAQIDQLAGRLGLGLDQLEITGHRRSNDADILDAVDLMHVRSFLTFSASAIQARIERLPWVSTATIERRLPNQVRIHITERAPFAIWRQGTRDTLIDRSGRSLQTIGRTANLDLPIVEGEHASDDATRMVELVQRYPDIAARLEKAERIAGRRWRLVLRDGPTIDLPADADAAALSMLVEPRPAGRLIDIAAASIDMSVLRRITVHKLTVTGQR